MKKYLPIICIIIFFSACFDSRSFEDDKAFCVKEDKKFYITEVLDYRTGKIKPKVICKKKNIFFYLNSIFIYK